MRKSIVTVLAALAAVATVPATAADTVSVSVGYADLNLAAPAGTAALEQRIEAAIREVCAKPDIRNLKAMTAWEECKASARASTLEQLSTLAPSDTEALAALV